MYRLCNNLEEEEGSETWYYLLLMARATHEYWDVSYWWALVVHDTTPSPALVSWCLNGWLVPPFCVSTIHTSTSPHLPMCSRKSLIRTSVIQTRRLSECIFWSHTHYFKLLSSVRSFRCSNGRYRVCQARSPRCMATEDTLRAKWAS